MTAPRTTVQVHLERAEHADSVSVTDHTSDGSAPYPFVVLHIGGADVFLRDQETVDALAHAFVRAEGLLAARRDRDEQAAAKAHHPAYLNPGVVMGRDEDGAGVPLRLSEACLTCGRRITELPGDPGTRRLWECPTGHRGEFRGGVAWVGKMSHPQPEEPGYRGQKGDPIRFRFGDQVLTGTIHNIVTANPLRYSVRSGGMPYIVQGTDVIRVSQVHNLPQPQPEHTPCTAVVSNDPPLQCERKEGHDGRHVAQQSDGDVFTRLPFALPSMGHRPS